MGIKKISYDIRIHPDRDPGVYSKSSDFLRPFINKYSYAFVLFNHEGCGQEQKLKDKIEIEIKESLERNGWKDRVEVIVFEPELEMRKQLALINVKNHRLKNLRMYC